MSNSCQVDQGRKQLTYLSCRRTWWAGEKDQIKGKLGEKGITQRLEQMRDEIRVWKATSRWVKEERRELREDGKKKENGGAKELIFEPNALPKNANSRVWR
jgi:hypothetical protein